MSKLRDKLFIWGQDAGSHHATGLWNLPGTNKMTPLEGCEYFGISNCARVVMSNKPEPPYDGEMEKLSGLEQVIWSVTGDATSNRTSTAHGDLDEVLRLAEKYPNLVGGILDDFFNIDRMNLGIYTPEGLEEIRTKMHAAQRPLPLYGVVYEGNIVPEQAPRVAPFFKHLDVITFWTWHAENLKDLEKNVAWLEEHAPGASLALGLYMWDYGNGKPYTKEEVAYQLSLATKWLLEKRIVSAFIVSNCIMDVGIEAVKWTKDWLDFVGDLEIPD